MFNEQLITMVEDLGHYKFWNFVKKFTFPISELIARNYLYRSKTIYSFRTRPRLRPRRFLANTITWVSFNVEPYNFSGCSCMVVRGTLLILDVARSKMADWRPFWMPKSLFLVYLPGNFHNRMRYWADIWHKYVALPYLLSCQKNRSPNSKWPNGGHLCFHSDLKFHQKIWHLGK